MAKTARLKGARMFAAGLMAAALAGSMTTSAALAGPPAASVGFNGPVNSVPITLTPPPTVRVHSPEALVSTLRSSFTGRVVIPFDAQWDLSGYAYLPLHADVSLIGERGPLGSRPLLFTTIRGFRKDTGLPATEITGSRENYQGYALFEVVGNGIAVGGIHFRGPANDSRSSDQPYVDAISVVEDGEKMGRQVVIADNELDQWTGRGVDVRTPGYNAADVAHYDPSWPRRTPADAGLVRVERNYIHHNAVDQGGYGVGVSGGAYVTIEGNVFDFNRHAVAADGYAYLGYIARFNYVLQGGFTEGSLGGYYNQHFDAHGAGAGGYGGLAGEYFEIDHNTIRGDQRYYVVQIRPAFLLRGNPTMGASFHDNVVVHDDLDEAVSFKGALSFDEITRGVKLNFHASGNLFDTDHSTELATGDFDGDGRTDVFVATGTAWFFSRAGIRPWEFLTASGRLTGELGFADIDNDGKTDVLWQAGNQTIYYSQSGNTAPLALTTAPVPMKDLRFGDFDGDGKTDIFYTLGGQWYIWYGRTHAWTAVESSSQPLSGLRFGEFDAVRGTDVVGMNNGAWAYSSGATQPWARLNDRLTDLADTVVADFDGNGRSDLAWSSGQKWYYSADGRSSRQVLRDGDSLLPYSGLKGLFIGPFDGGTRARVVSFDLKASGGLGGFSFSSGERLVIWNGLGSSSTFSVRSTQNMR